jgi:hypothetical protein
VSLQVIGTVLGRTGTLSLQLALERLGFAPCEHMISPFTEEARVTRWREATHRTSAGAPVDWGSLFGGYRATVDWPGVIFWRILVAAYPDARVVLTARLPW